MVSKVVAHFGRVDILVNVAGGSGSRIIYDIEDMSDDIWDGVINSNLRGTFLASRAVVPLMLEGKYGRIVNIASIAGKEGNPNASHYSAAKAGVVGLTKSLGKELAQQGILVNCITPAVIQTDILKQVSQYHIDYMLSKIPMNRFVEVQEIAAMVRDKQIDGISDLRDESSRDGMRIVIELKRGELPDVVLNNLYKHTKLQMSYGITLLAIVANRPHVLNLLQIVEHFIDSVGVVSWRFFSASEHAAEHHRISTSSNRFRYIARVANAAIGNGRHARAFEGLGHFAHGRDLRNAYARDDTRGADRTRTHADLHGIGAGIVLGFIGSVLAVMRFLGLVASR